MFIDYTFLFTVYRRSIIISSGTRKSVSLRSAKPAARLDRPRKYTVFSIINNIQAPYAAHSQPGNRYRKGAFYMGKISIKKILLITAAVIIIFAFLSCNSSSGDGSGLTAADIEGTWLKVWVGETFDFDGEGSPNVADAAIFEFDGDEYAIIMYFETKQVGGNKGTFNVADNSLEYSPDENWRYDEYVWHSTTETIPATPVTLSGNRLTVNVNGTVIVLEKTLFGNPGSLAGNWVEVEGDIVVFLGSADPYNYDYYEPGEGDSGEHAEQGSWKASGTTEGYVRTLAEYVDGTAGVSLEGLTSYGISGEQLILMYPDGDGGYVPVYFEISYGDLL